MQTLLNCLGQRESRWVLQLFWDEAHFTGSTADIFGRVAVNCSLLSLSLPQAGRFPGTWAPGSCRMTAGGGLVASLPETCAVCQAC